MNIPYIPKKLDCFISTVANFKESICYHAAELKEEPGQLYAAFHQRGSKPEIGKIPLEDLAGPYARCHYYRKDNERLADRPYHPGPVFNL